MPLGNRKGNQTLKTLANIVLGTPVPDDSFLVTRCKELVNKPIAEFSVEDLRIMIVQKIGTEHLVPLALDILENDVLAEGDFYPGDLLQSVLGLESEFWIKNPDHFKRITQIINAQYEIVKDAGIKLGNFDRLS